MSMDHGDRSPTMAKLGFPTTLLRVGRPTTMDIGLGSTRGAGVG